MLSFLNCFFNRNHIELLSFVPLNRQASFFCSILCCPVCFIFIIYYISWFECYIISTNIRCLNCCILCQILSESFFHILSKFCHSVENWLIHCTLIIRRYIQKHGCIMSYRIKVHVSKLCNCLRSVLFGSPEPSGCNTSVTLRNCPFITSFISFGIRCTSIAVNSIIFIIDI